MIKIVIHPIERRSAILTISRVIKPIAFIFLFSFILMPFLSFAQEDVSKDDRLLGLWHLSAGKFIYDIKTGNIILSENVRLESELSNDVLEFREGSFNRKDGTGKMLGGMLFLSENNFRIQGEVIQKGVNDTYSVEDFHLTSCDNKVPTWSITGSKITIALEGYGTLKNATFRVKDFPVFYLPYMIFPAKTKRQTGLLLPLFDSSNRNGYGIEMPLFWNISDHSDATLYERYMTKRGFMHGIEFRYITRHNSKGEVLFDILKDEIGVKDLTDPYQANVTPFERENQNRYWLRGRLDQGLSHDTTARLDLDLVSDQDYLREFDGEFTGFEQRPDLADDFGRPIEERYSSFRRSAFRIDHDGEDYSLQGSGYYHQIPEIQGDDNTSQPLAGLYHSLLPKQLPRLPIFFNMNTDYNYIWRDTGIKGHSLSFNPEILYPKQLGDYIKLDSSLAYRANLESYDISYENKDSTFKDAYQAQVALSTVLERIFDINRQDVTRLKHKITPVISYEYSILPDEQDKSPWFDPIDSGSNRNGIGMSIQNLLDASLKDENGNVSYRQWARFDITQRYNIREIRRDDKVDEDKEAWEPVQATLILSPFNVLNFKANAAWDHYKDGFSTSVLSANIYIPRSEDRSDRLYIDYVKDYENNNSSLNLNAEVNLIKSISAGALLNRDLDMKYNIHNSVWVKFKAQCWSIKLTMETEETDRHISVKFGLGGFD